ncbi:MAG: hypothetical protein NTV86_08880 [Planctomycetota bacterium]|nr:hypothetical protein [Planctomycetota bacterium]
MIYHPGKGAMWDPSILWHDGRYYAFMMYNRDGVNGLEAKHCLLAVSDDGVHWHDEAVVIEELERDRDCKVFKCMVARCGDRFILNHGVARPEGQDMLRFYESSDLRHWNYLYSTRPDPRWYGLPPDPHRWDHMYMLPKVENVGENPAAGYWGYPVAIAKPGDPRGVGMMQSADGRQWEPLPPAKVEWGDTPPVDLEWGGCERIGGRYYLIGGGVYLGFKAYGMFTFVADDPRGPFRPAPGPMRLCGNSDTHISWLAVWCRGHDELLISNYASIAPGNLAPWLLPLRKPLLDPDGSLHLTWWPGNDALKGQPLPLSKPSLALDAANGYAVTWLDERFNPDRGVIVEGVLRARPAVGAAGVNTPASVEQTPAAGFALAEPDGHAMLALIGLGSPADSQTQIGRLNADGGTFALMDASGPPHSATLTALAPGRDHSFRLLSRSGLFEFYLDDRLAQTFFYTPGPGRVGFALRHAHADLTALRAWEMSLH